MSNEKTGIEQYWDWLNSLDEEVRAAVLLVSDETGRPIAPECVGVVSLLDNSGTFDEFYEKYLSFRNHNEDSDLYTLNANAQMFYKVYVCGMKRVGRELKPMKLDEVE